MTPIALLIASTLAQAPSALDWKPVKPPDGSFSAEMPAEPRHATREIPSPQGSFHRDTDPCTYDGANFAIEATRYAGPIPEQTRSATLERAVSEYIAARKGQVVRESEITVDGRPGWDLTIRGPLPGAKAGVVTSRCRIVLGAQTMYCVSVVSPVDRPLPAPAGRFLRSFRFDPMPPVQVADATPEQALRTFLLATAAQDEAALGAVALPAEGLDKLLEGTPLAPALFAAARRYFATLPIKVLKAGDEFTLPATKKKQDVPPDEVAEDRAVLLPKDAPLPTRLRKVEGRWKVDAQPLIEARKAAESPRARSKSKKGAR